MSERAAVRVADLTADEIERRLDAGETLEVYMKRRHGLGVIAAGVIMSGAFAFQAWRAEGDLAFFPLVLGLPSLTLILIGFSRFRTPRRAFELTPEGIAAFVRPLDRDWIPWEQVRDVEFRHGGVHVEIDPDVPIDRMWIERWSGLWSRLLGQRRFHGFVLPAKGAEVDADALMEYLERRVRQDMLRERGGSAGPEAPERE